jgi:AcrR family transcriptional regulator
VLVAVTKRKSTDVSERSDARARRTRARIDAAFVELLHRRAYAGIRVSDVARKSGIGRATFYAHYDGKDALLRSQMDRIVAPMLRATEADWIDATALFAHVLERPRIYAAIMAGDGRRVVEASLEGRVAGLHAARERAHGAPPSSRDALVARMVASTLGGLVAWCAERRDQTADEMQRAFRAVTGRASAV